MRGADSYTESQFTTVKLGDFVPGTHPLRPIRQVIVQGRDKVGPSSFRVEPNSQNPWSSSSPVGMWAGCL